MYEGGLKVPTCVVWGEQVKPSSINRGVCLTMDLFPTICEIAGAKYDHKIDGKSIMPLLKQQEAELNLVG